MSTGTLERPSTTIRAYTCGQCGLEFERPQRGRPPKFCDECRRRRRLEDDARLRERRRLGLAGVAKESPGYPLLVEFVNHECRVRLALACVRTGRYAMAAEVLEEELGR